LTAKLGIKIVRKRIPTRRSVVFLQLWPNGWMDVAKLLDGWRCHLVKR